MELRDWFKKYHNRPLTVAAGFLLAVWFVFAGVSYVTISEKQYSSTQQIADLLSVTVGSKDRVMSERLLESFISQSGATSAGICDGNKLLIGINQDLTDCIAKNTLFSKVILSSLPGSSSLKLNAKFNMIESLSAVFSILGFGFTLVIAGFYFIQLAQRRMERDILNPLLNKLLSNEKLEIKELHELQEGVIKTQKLEAEKAVTLAIQENNQQVAHDIRSPIASLNELFGMVKIADFEKKSAINIALARANSVAKALLASEKTEQQENPKSSFNVSSVLRDIITEKSPLFKGGKFELNVIDYLFVATKLSEDSLARVLSNIVDNAMLACENKKEIVISAKKENESVVIEVKDSGRGISPEVFQNLGVKGFSSRPDHQSSGSGRGVYSAKQSLSAVGGSIEFKNNPCGGAIVEITIPNNPIQLIENPDLVVVDNEALIHMCWYHCSKDNNLNCQTFFSIGDFLASAHKIKKTIPIFLDSMMGDVRGEDFAPLIKELGFKHVVLQTSSSEELEGEVLPSIDAIIGKNPTDGMGLLMSWKTLNYEKC